ncbi:MAG: hypothetical protein HDT32_06690 [Clostridiales bacterium]|nr:hypothetical protein [Clostridiales bacterium]
MVLCVAACFIATKTVNAEIVSENEVFGGGNGTTLSPYLVSSAQDMVAIMDGVNNITAPDGYFGKTFKLTQDIDLSSVDMSPIGNFIYPFKGKFYGEGYAISGIDIYVESGSYTGLFGVLSADAIVDNLKVEGSVVGYSETGGLAGFNNGTINQCISNIAVSNIDDNVVGNIGGICGYNKGIIKNSINRAVVLGHGVNTGGIAGLNDSLGEILDCFNVGEIQSTFYDVGGIAGHNDGTVDGCFNSAQIMAYSTVGGITGSNSGYVQNVYNTGKIVATANIAGGISGSNDSEISSAFSRAEISANSLKYGICGFMSEGSVLNACFLNSDKFSGRMTNRGDNYPNSAILSDYDMVLPNVLEDDGAMALLQSDESDGKWIKRSFDENCYLPELKSFYDILVDEITQYSKQSVAIQRQFTKDIALGTLSFVYNGQANEPDVYMGGETLSRNVDYNVTYDDNINVGKVTASITFINYYKGETEKNFDIKKRALSVKWVERNIVYNGEVQHPVVEITAGRVEGDNVTFVYTGAGVDVGNYEVKAQLADNDINSNYSFVPVSKKYEIAKSQLQISWENGDIAYNGAAQYPKAHVIGGAFGDDKFDLNYYGYENNISAGQGYTVLITASGNDNYFLKETHTYDIYKKRITATFENTVFTYNGACQYPKIVEIQGGVHDEIILFDYSGYENNVSAGDSYKVFARLANNAVNSNYEFDIQECIYSIVVKELTIEWLENSLVYNGSAQYPKFTVDGLIKGDNVEWIISDYSANIDASEGKTYSVDVALGECANYIFQPVTIEYGISPMSITIAWKDEPIIYNGQVQYPQALVIEKTPNQVPLVYSNYNGIDAGTGYSITVVSQSKNYIVVNELKYDILPKPISVTWDSDEFIYNGKTQYPTAQIDTSAVEIDLDFEYVKEESVRAGKYSISMTPDDSNYTFDKATIYYIIKPKKLSIEGISADDRVYDGSKNARLHGGTLMGVEDNDNIEFVLSDVLTQSANVGNWSVDYNITLKGQNADCYFVEKSIVTININKAVFDLSSLKFESKTFAFDGEAKAISVDGNLPDCIQIEYDGNNKSNVGEYVVTARFIDAYGNFEAIPQMQATLYVANAVLKDNQYAISVSAVNGVLPYGAELKISSDAELSEEYGKKVAVGVYKISLLNDGKEIQPDCRLQIVKFLDKKTASLKNLTLLQVVDGDYREIEFTLDGDRLIFYADSPSEFVLLADKQNDWIWYVLAALFVVIISTVITVVFIMRRKKKIFIAATVTEENAQQGIDKKDGNDIFDTIEDSVEIPFVIDGVECAGLKSFLASLCYKDTLKQKEIARLNDNQAWARANGKGGAGRRELYWQGKRIMRNSKEYFDLIKRAEEEIAKNTKTIMK